MTDMGFPIFSIYSQTNPWVSHDAKTVTLPYDSLPKIVRLHIVLQGGSANVPEMQTEEKPRVVPAKDDPFWNLTGIYKELVPDSPFPSELQELHKIGEFVQRLNERGLGESYEAKHAELIVDYIPAIRKRHELLKAGTLAPLPPASQKAADLLYFSTMVKLIQGLKKID